jgi:hypothetical protein
LKKIIPLIILFMAAMVIAAGAQDKATFSGKIEEIAIKTTMTPVGAMEKSLVIKLDSQPKKDIRAAAADAARFGLIDTDQPGAVLKPGQVKGVGWKVRLTCEKKSSFGGDPVYQVVNLEKLD